MNLTAYEYILLKQTAWAKSKGITLVGSKGDRGRLAYTRSLNDNLFEPLGAQVKADIDKGDGNELKGPGPFKMQAVHSSSALGVNVFQYWMKHNINEIAAACGFCSMSGKSSTGIRFEQKFQIDKKFTRNPNIDVVIENAPGSEFDLFAIECKFSEAYSSRGHVGLDEKYFDLKLLWDNYPELLIFSQDIRSEDGTFFHLHPAQLVKHILGLTAQKGVGRFKLLYLWYDCPGDEGARHRHEVEKFLNVAQKDGINFHAMTYQELIAKLAKEFSQTHEKYVQYMLNRYL